MRTLILLVLTVFMSVPAMAAQVNYDCTGRDDAQNEGIKSLEVSMNSKDIVYTAMTTDGNTAKSSAARDVHFDFSHPSSPQARYEDRSVTRSVFVSPSVVSFFVDKALIWGQNGTIVVSVSPDSVEYDSYTFDCTVAN